MKTAILSSHDYEPYGSALPYRGFEGDKYQFGFNSQEKDFDIIEGMYGAEFWEYDSRICRRWNLDPVVYASISGYACFLGNPIYFADPSGASAFGNFFKAIGNFFKKVWTSAHDAKYNIGYAKTVWGKVWTTIKKGASTVGNFMGKVGKSIGSYFKELGSDIANDFTNGFTKEEWHNLKRDIKSIGKLKDGVQEYAKNDDIKNSTASNGNPSSTFDLSGLLKIFDLYSNMPEKPENNLENLKNLNEANDKALEVANEKENDETILPQTDETVKKNVKKQVKIITHGTLFKPEGSLIWYDEYYCNGKLFKLVPIEIKRK